MVSQLEIDKLLETPYDNLRILRQPLAVLNTTIDNQPTITCLYDRYTDVNSIKILYYKQPVYFSILTSTACELPIEAFDDLVTGAVELYIAYIRTGSRPTSKTEQPKQNSND